MAGAAGGVSPTLGDGADLSSAPAGRAVPSSLRGCCRWREGAGLFLAPESWPGILTGSQDPRAPGGRGALAPALRGPRALARACWLAAPPHLVPGAKPFSPHSDPICWGQRRTPGLRGSPQATRLGFGPQGGAGLMLTCPRLGAAVGHSSPAACTGHRLAAPGSSSRRPAGPRMRCRPALPSARNALPCTRPRPLLPVSA